MHEQVLNLGALGGSIKLFQHMGIGELKFRKLGAAKRLQVRAAAKLLSHVVRHGAHVGAGRNANAEAGSDAIELRYLELLDFGLDRFQ